MRKTLLIGIVVFGVCACAQTPTEPPVLIRLIRSDSGLPGDGRAIRPYVDANAPVTVFGLTSITGLSETWLIESHDSFAGIEDLDRALGSFPSAGRAGPSQQDDLIASSRTMIALYRPGFSYRPDQAIRMFPTARYFHVSIYRTKPGADADFAEMVKLRRLSADSVNLDRPDIAYQVVSGAPSGTYVFLAPLASLRILDNGLARVPVYAEGVADARKKIALESEIGREHLLFRIEPRLSRVSEDFAAVDPDFWAPNRKRQ